MGEPRDYNPGIHRTHDFKQAQRSYQTFARQRVEEAARKEEPASNLIPVSLSTNCRWPLILPTDVTGSVGEEWLKIFFSKFPYIFVEGKFYMGQDLQICYGAIGDLHPAKNSGSPDKYFFQAVNFVDDRQAAEAIKKLIPEGGGGGQVREDYQLWALYALNNISFPKARRKPLIIYMGDEAPYDQVTREEGKRIHVNLDKNIKTDDIFKLLKEKYTVYMARKSYGGANEHGIHMRWVNLLGDSRVCVLQKPDRIADIIFGIMAKESGKIPYYMAEMKKRQSPEQCKEAFSVLEPIFADDEPDGMLIENESDDGSETSRLI